MDLNLDLKLNVNTLRPLAGEGRKLFVETYGCQMNVGDTEIVVSIMQGEGYVYTEHIDEADVVLINTCSIRDNAEQRIWGRLRELRGLRRRRPSLLIGIIGCMAERLKERLVEGDDAVDIVAGPDSYRDLPRLVREAEAGGKGVNVLLSSEETYAEIAPVRLDRNGVSAFVAIMRGCNNFCSYCIVPYVRGRERSRRPEEILEEVKGLIAAGYKDITLLGQNVNSYGKDLGLGVDFADLMAEIAQLPGEFWLRFMTSHPKDASKKLFDTIAKYPKIAKQFHLPFQSGNDRVLKAMNRHYNREEYLKLAHYGRAIMPDLVLTSDVIVGFPGETEDEFEDTISLIEDVRYDALFTFIFSPRAGTPAAKMDDPTPKEEKNRRFDRLCDVQNRISLEIHQGYVGKTVRVLCDGRDKDMLTARTEGGRLVRFAGDDSLIGQFFDVTITGCTTWSLVGELR